MPSRSSLVVPMIAVLVSVAAAAPVNRPLDTAHPDARPLEHTVVRHDDQGLTLRLDLGQVGVEQVSLAGRSWTALSLEAGVLDGQPGETALPVWSTLIAVPDGATVTVSGTVGESVIWRDLDLAPQTRPDGSLEALDLVGKALSREPELVSVGEPARMAGVTVVPVTIRPVSYDAQRRQAVVAGRVDVDVRWEGAGWSNGRTLPASMNDLASGVVSNWPEVRDELMIGDATYGTWAVVLPGAPFESLVEPLLDWRRRQGYNVVVSDLGQIGATEEAVLAYLQGLYDTVDPPLEFVTLVGDGAGSVAVPTWREELSGFRGEGDHFYTLLDGDDPLPDVHIGRLSVRNASELSTVVSKIIQYETNPPRDNTDWFTRGLAVGDAEDSGTSTIFCARWLADQLYGIGFDRVDQIVGGDFATTMYNSLNEGKSVFGYRGFYGVSGFSEGHAMSLQNGGRLPFALFPTCESASWLSTTTARSEAFLRNPNGGAIGAVGTATPGTHTRYNNCFFYGTIEGLVNSSEHRQGPALSRGKLEMFRNYGAAEPNIVPIWSTWNTLMGDPATDIWLAVPSELTVTHPGAVPAQATGLPVTVEIDGVPVEGAHVAATDGSDLRAVARTDADGTVLLPIDGVPAGNLLVAVTGHNLLPYQGSVTVASQDVWVEATGLTVDGDGLASPAETVGLVLDLQNLGQVHTVDTELLVVSNSPWLTVLDASAPVPLMAPGATGSSVEYGVAIDPRAPHGTPAQLRLEYADHGSGESWIGQIALLVQGPDLRLDAAGFDPAAPQPGGTHDLVATVTNTGVLPAAGGQAILRSRSLWVTIDDSTGTLPSVPVGATMSNAADPFQVTFDAGMVAGATVPMTLVVYHDDGVEHRLDLSVAVGERTVTDPTGGDQYGYYAFDSGDVGYAEARPFAWIEIDPTRGGQGESVGLTDTYYERDDSEVMPLPFPFTYYGQEFGELTICSNGWVSFGATTEVFWRNWSIPSAGSPDAMVAVFWDDLHESLDNRVYHWYDETEHRYVVQWSRMENLLDGQQTCQVILLDPAHHPTRSGDGIIVCQYLEVDNNDVERGYATLGIQSPDRQQGVCYSYYNIEAPGAAVPEAGLAITYRTAGRREPRTCDVSPASIALTLPQGGTEDLTLHVLNDGEPGDPLTFEIVQMDPALFDPAARSMEGSTASLTETSYWPGEPTTFNVAVTNNSPDNEWVESFTIELPSGVTLVDGTDMVGTDGHTLTWQGQPGDGEPAVWVGTGGQLLYPEAVGTAAFTVEIDYGVGDLALPWTIQGDVYGGEPHAVSGVFNVDCAGLLLTLVSPNGGEVWSLGDERLIVWEASADIPLIDLLVSRDDGATWQSELSNWDADQPFTWTVSGDVTNEARFQVRKSGQEEVADRSAAAFTIQNDLSWVQLSQSAGSVLAGNTEQIILSLDAGQLALGDHLQYLVVHNNAGDDVVVPLTLTVEDGALGADLPLATKLFQNHPNPFNPSTTIRFDLAHDTTVDLAVFDLAGRRVAQLVSGSQRAGRHAVVWTGRDQAGRQLSSGTYLYRLMAGREVSTRKFTLVK